MPARPDPAAVLASFGLAPGPSGWRLVDLVDLALAAGLRATVEPEERPTRGRRFRALVFRPPDPRASDGRGMRATRGRGPTEEDALARALASALGHGAN